MKTSLLSLWESLPAPTGGEAAFTAARIPEAPGVRLGRGEHGPALLFALTQKGAAEPPIELRTLSVRFNALCTITEGAADESGYFTVVASATEDEQAWLLFLSALGPLLSAFVDSTPTRIRQLIDALVELFRASSRPPTTSVLGVWGELTAIAESADPDALLRAWHQMPNDRFDFAQTDCRVDIKTTTGQRVHRISLDQLRPPPGTNAWIYSIVTESSAAGSTVLELVERITERCSDPGSPGILLTSVATLLGSSVDEWTKTRYDDARAAATCALFRGADVPRPLDPPAEVTNVHFDVDLASITPSKADAGLAALLA